MIDTASFERVKNCFAGGQRFVLTTHINPDGDGLGSQAALAKFLEDNNKDVFIFNCSPVPNNYDFLNPQNKFIFYKSDLHRETLLTADFIIILDISDWQRLRQVGDDIRNTNIKKICIDHHPPSEKFGDINLVDINACSTGEIVFDLIKHCNGKIDKTIATALYASILTDTGSFKFSNTNPKAFKIAGELVEIGINPHKIYQKVYERQGLNKIKLFAHVLNDLHFENNGRIVWFYVSNETLRSCGANYYDADGFADYPRVIDGVEVTVMFIETDEGRTKVSLRSKGNYAINEVAKKFGGGGHPYAAGVILNGSYKEYKSLLITEINDLLNSN